MSELVDAWQTWWSGAQTGSLPLWGHKVLWWGRLGKLAQFAGALTVIVELIGPTRLRAWGSVLRGHSRPLGQRLRALFGTLGGAFTAVLEVFALGDDDEHDDTPERRKRREQVQQALKAAGVGMWLPMVTILILLWIMLALAPVVEDMPVWLLLIAVAVLPPIVFALVTALLRVVPMVLGVAIDAVLVRPTAAVLEHERTASRIKWLGVALLVAGFHFDLLAS